MIVAEDFLDLVEARVCLVHLVELFVVQVGGAEDALAQQVVVDGDLIAVLGPERVCVRLRVRRSLGACCLQRRLALPTK